MSRTGALPGVVAAGSAPPGRPAWVAAGQVPCLDGLRAVSILLVILSHFSRPGAPWGQYGSRGVDVFFVISGFLITLLMVREVEATGRIALGQFYARRAWRIMPAYLAYLGFVWSWTQVRGEPIRSGPWVGVLTYTTNLRSDWTAPYCLAHTWSLALEEHFYLLWPPILAVLGRHRAAWLLVLGLLAAPAVRYAFLKLPTPVCDVRVATPTRIDAILAGCLLALLATGPTGARAWPRLIPATAVLFVAGALLVASEAVSGRHPIYQNLFRTSLESVTIAAALLAVVAAPGSLAGLVLQVRPLAVIGNLSYSLYLWQQAFSDPRPEWACRPPQNLALTALAAVGSYLGIERPCRRLRDRLFRSPQGRVPRVP